MADINIKTITLNKLTQEQYSGATINPNEFYLITDAPEPLTEADQITTAQIQDQAVTEAKLALAVQNKIKAAIALIPKVNEKADKSDTYTKAEVDQKISDALGTIETALAEV